MNSDTKCTAVTAKYNQLIPLKQELLFWESNAVESYKNYYM